MNVCSYKNCVFAYRNMTDPKKYGGSMLIGVLGVSMIGLGLLPRMKGRVVYPIKCIARHKALGARHKALGARLNKDPK